MTGSIPQRPEWLAQRILFSPNIGEAVDRRDTAGAVLDDVNRRLAGGDVSGAEHLLRQLVMAVPRALEIKLMLAGLYCDTRNYDHALPLLDDILSVEPSNTDALNNKAIALYHRDDVEGAIRITERLIRMFPKRANSHNNLGVYRMAKGDFAAAEDSFRRALSLRPDYVDAWHNLCDIPNFDMTDQQRALLSGLLARDTWSDTERALLEFCISKYYRGRGRPSHEFRHLDRAKSLLAALQPWDAEGFLHGVEALTAVTADTFREYRRRDAPNPQPIFVTSMPRAGSTLVAQIVSAHPLVSVIGEAGLGSRGTAAVAARFPDLGRDYWEWFGGPQTEPALRTAFATIDAAIASFATTTPFVAEKSINNDIALGLCLLAYPDAKVVHCRRDPRDACLSAYQAYFPGGLRYNNKLAWLAQRQRLHERLMDFWHTVFPGAIVTVQYETLVADPRSEIRRLLAGLGLPWDESCLDFHRVDGAVRSASNWQVRQPLYRTSVGRWSRYRDQLASVLSLDPAARD